MRHSLLTNISVIMTLLFASFGVQANPTSPEPQAPFPLKGERLPVYRLDKRDSSLLNWPWKILAHRLRVADLHVYRYSDFASNGAVQQHVSSRLKAAGYTLSKVTSFPRIYITVFYAKRDKEVIGAAWFNGSTFYWGHVAPITTQSKLDDGLIDAVYEGNSDAAKKLLTEGADPYARDYSRDSVLKIAADRNAVAITKMLLAAQKAQPSGPSDKDILGALKVASEKDNSDIVETIVDEGVTTYQIGISLKIAASANAGKVIEVLLPVSSQYDINEALVIAAFVKEKRTQYPDLVKELLLRNPSQSALNRAMIAAAQGDEAEIVPLFIAAGANVDAQDAQGNTALLHAAYDSAYSAEQADVAALLKAGANPNLSNKRGETALMHAAIANWPTTVKMLLAYGADPNLRNTSGKNALDLAKARQLTADKRFRNKLDVNARQLTAIKGYIIKLDKNTQLIENAIKQSNKQ